MSRSTPTATAWRTSSPSTATSPNWTPTCPRPSTLATGEQVDLQFVNGLGGNVDTNTFDTNVVSLPVSLAALGLTKSSAPVSYRVTTYSQYNTDETGANVPVDTTKWIKFNAINPDLSFAGAGTVFADLDKSKLTATVASNDTKAKALFLHLHNASGNRAQVVDVEVRK